MRKFLIRSIYTVLVLTIVLALAGAVYAVNCWENDFTDQSTCESAGTGEDCSWDEWGKYCMEKGCWNYWDQADCVAANTTGCFWQTESNMGWDTGWCEESQDCWNYWTNASCIELSGCQWKSTSCQGPPGCEDLSTQSTCDASYLGCWWDYGNYCYKPGCWDYWVEDSCDSASGCNWRANAYCTESGGNCWNYNAQTDCIAQTGCKWDSWGSEDTEGWCNKIGCWDYYNSSSCSSDPTGKCAWEGSNDTGWCYEKNCWNYYNQGNCTANPNSVDGGCNWQSSGQCSEPNCNDITDGTACNASVGCYWDNSNCNWEGCWNYNTEGQCDNITGCQWKTPACRGDSECSSNSDYDSCTSSTYSCWWDWGDYCEDVDCWGFDTNQTYCENDTAVHNLDCTWDSYWNNCYEKWCGEYTDETECNNSISGDCSWKNGWCQEESCWGHNANATCTDAGCQWDSGWGYCEQAASASCYDLDQTACTNATYNATCRWDQWGNYCSEKGCWDLQNNASCSSSNLSVSCEWTQDSGGWCEDSGVNCWDLYLESDCTANNCSWDSAWSTCNEKGCWNNWDNASCSGDTSCSWKTSSDMGDWGWCEKRACWNWDNTDGDSCVNNTYNLTCAWDGTDGGWCSGPWQNNCWEHDSWTGGTEAQCTGDNASGINCTWNAMNGWCYEAVKDFTDFTNEGECLKSGWGKWNGTDCVASGEVMQNPGCWIFDGRSAECSAVKGCTYNATNSECNGLDIEGIQCANITSVVVNNATNQTLCEVIPMLSTCCKFVAGQCQTTYDAVCWDQMAETPDGGAHCMDYNAIDSPTICNQIAGDPWYMPCTWNNVSGQCNFKGDMATDVEDVKTKKNCEFLGGVWKTETVCGTDDCPYTESWCEMETGTSLYGCDSSCWACNSSTTCRQSNKGYCQWVVDSDLPQGGYCDIPEKIELHGDCDTFCTSCEFYSGGRGENVYTPESACKGSEAQCKWDNLTSVCVEKKSKSCSEDCFSCFDKDDCSLNGGGSQGTCKWDESTGICKPGDFTGEICFDGKNNDDDDLIDCSDPDCMFDTFCGAGDMSSCWMYMDNSSCVTNDCAWFQDKWTNTYRCGMKGENCWTNEGDPTTCGTDPNCQWYSETHCEINHTKSDDCFKKSTQTGCEANTYCTWQDDSYSPQGGWCDFAVFECHWNQSLGASKTVCEGNSFCKWQTDTWSNEGWCEPKCFARDSNGDELYGTQTSCEGAITGGLCEWSTGWCETNSTTVGVVSERGCAAYDINRTACDAQPGCAWFEEMMMGPGMGPESGGGFFGSQCESKHSIDCWMFQNSSTCNSSFRNGTFNNAGDGNACRWVQDGSWGWCDQIGMHCGPMYSPFCIGNTCYSQPQTNATACNADTYCMTMNDSYMDNQEICVAKCHNSSLNMTTCQATAGGDLCVWMGEGAGGEEVIEGTMPEGMQMGGWCDPAGSHDVFQAMEGGPPSPIGFDDTGDAHSDYVDIVGFGIKEMSDDYAVGIGVQSMTYAAACNGETLWDGSSGSGRKTTKGFWYLDTDGVETGGCDSDNGAYSGFEFKLIGDWQWSNDGLKEALSAKRCLAGNWTAANIRLQTHSKKMCQEIQGMIITVSKDDLVNFPNLFNPTYPMRIYVATAGENNTANSPADSVSSPGYYMSGTVDFKLEDCNALGNIDMDNDGFFAYEDPDCKHVYLDEDKGFKSVEDCKTAQDDNMNGLTNCDDPACKDELVCGGTLAIDITDHTAPEMKQTKEHEHKHSSDIDYTTDERSNGTLLFYKTDSSCSMLNATIRDRGLWGNNTNYQKYKFKHSAEVDNLTHTDSLGYGLQNGTAYYYKLKFCDISGNCGQTACSNFTTKAASETKTMKFTDPDSGESWLVDTGTGSYAQQGGGCALISNSSLGSMIDPETTPNIDIKQTQTASSGNITIGIGGIDTSASQAIDNLDMDIGTVTGHESGATEDYVWMNESGWDGNDGLYSQGAPDNVTITLPGSDTHLYDCKDMSGGTLVNCTDITDYATSSYDSTTDTTTWTIPDPTADLWSYIVPQTPSTSTTTTSSSSGGSSSSLSSAPVSGGTLAGYKKTVLFLDLSPNVKNKISIDLEGLAVTKNHFKVNKDLELLKVTVEKLEVANAPEAIDNAYQYFKISTQGMGNAALLGGALIEFRITETWIADYDEDLVALYRYNNGWGELPTIKSRKEDGYVYYQAEANTFETFAIVALPKGSEKAVAEPEFKGIEQITGAVVQDISKVDTSNINSMLVGGLIVAALVVLLVWWLTRRVEPPVQPQQPQQ